MCGLEEVLWMNDLLDLVGFDWRMGGKEVVELFWVGCAGVYGKWELVWIEGVWFWINYSYILYIDLFSTIERYF